MSGLVPGYLHIVNSIKARTVRTAVTTDKPAKRILEVVVVVVVENIKWQFHHDNLVCGTTRAILAIKTLTT